MRNAYSRLRRERCRVAVATRWGALGVLLLSPAALPAQLGCSAATCTVEITLPVSDVMRLSVSQTSVSLGAPTIADFTAGYRDINGAAAVVTVKANRAFQVQLVGTTSTFAYSGTFANPVKPASDLTWATSQAGLSSSGNTAATSLTFIDQSASGSANQSLFLRTMWSFARDVPGTYSIVLSLTISAP